MIAITDQGGAEPMTAEIAVMNKSGIALAADSKVSIGGSPPSKGYDTVNKLFALSHSHPVGIMVFGNAELMGVPWETLIKFYRQNIGDKSFEKVEDWSSNFIDFINKFDLFDERSILDNTRTIVRNQISFLIKELNYLHNSLDCEPKEQREIFFEMLNSTEDQIKQDLIPGSRNSKSTLEIIDHEIENEPTGDKEIDEKIKSILKLTTRAKTQSNLSSGIVISGFGDKEIFPSLVEFSTDGIINNTFRISSASPTSISYSTTSCIRSFAQHDMVQRFMMGADGNFLETITRTFQELIEGVSHHNLIEYGKKSSQTQKNQDELTLQSHEVTEAFSEKLLSYIRDEYTRPVTRMVSLLPKEELGHLAESLVALTSLKRRVSIEMETVGGPIDVALISKGDGFVWLKRKHYFPPELNHQFFRNYGRS
ncbi:MAG: hypothetical protein ACO1NN_09495 [Sphingopyxis sp.]